MPGGLLAEMKVLLPRHADRLIPPPMLMHSERAKTGRHTGSYAGLYVPDLGSKHFLISSMNEQIALNPSRWHDL